MAGEITVTDLQNAKLDVETIAEVAMVGYTSDTTTNRNGDTVYTLQGQLKRLGYIPPVTYAGAISFGALENTKTIERSGYIYAPLPSALPFTTSGTWVGSDETKFFVVQSSSSVTVDAGNVAFDTTGTSISGITAQAAIAELDDDVGDAVTALGVARNATTMGTFTGATIPDGQTGKQAIQALETAHEALTARAARYAESTAGTSTAYTATMSPTLTAYADKFTIIIDPAATSTSTTPTLNVDSLGAKDIKKFGGGAVVVGDIVSGYPAILQYNSAGSGTWELLNPRYHPGAVGTAYVSSSYSNNSTLTLTNPLPVEPFCILFKAINGSTEAGWAPGEYFYMAASRDNTADGGFNYEMSSSNIKMYINKLMGTNKTTYNKFELTPAKWTVSVVVTGIVTGTIS